MSPIHRDQVLGTSNGAEQQHRNGTRPAQHVEWPAPPARDAFHGLAGEIVDTLAPHTEGDRAALLVSLLTGFGNIVGRGPGFRVGGTFHATNLYAVIVGPTAIGRKGTSWDEIERLLARVDPAWTERTDGTLSSGEGVIHAVRDAIGERRAPRKGEIPDTDGLVQDTKDPGEADKRLMVVEAEFAQALRVMRREGNTLSPIVRRLWDRGNVRMLTKNSPTRTTGALVSIIGHISADELRRQLDDAEIANGFANRFAYVCARRARELPFGGTLTDRALDPLVEQLRHAVRHGTVCAEIDMDTGARERWVSVYGRLSGERPGLLGAVTARAAPIARRLAVIYALMDLAPVIRLEHLDAALAVWDYCERSAAHVFGGRLGHPLADRLLAALRAAGDRGLDRVALHAVAGRHATATQLDEALAQLAGRQLARSERIATAGRPAERWCATREESEVSEESPPDPDLSSHSSLYSHPANGLVEQS